MAGEVAALRVGGRLGVDQDRERCGRVPIAIRPPSRVAAPLEPSYAALVEPLLDVLLGHHQQLFNLWPGGDAHLKRVLVGPKVAEVRAEPLQRFPRELRRGAAVIQTCPDRLDSARDVIPHRHGDVALGPAQGRERRLDDAVRAVCRAAPCSAS